MFEPVFDPFTGQFVMMPVEPGLTPEQRDHLRPGGLPEAELAGASGPGVVPLGHVTGRNRGARPGQDPDKPTPTHRPLAGAQQNNRGNTQTVKALFDSPGVNSRPAFVNSVVETSKDSGDDAELITVSLGLEWTNVPDGENPDGGALSVQAIVSWGIGGVQHQAIIDWENGLIFSIPASFLRIGAVYYSPTNLGVTPPDAILFASLSYGTAPTRRGSGARLTSRLGGPFLTGTSQTVQVPRFARSFTYVPAAVPAVPNAVEMAVRTDGVPGVGGFIQAIYTLGGQSNSQIMAEDAFPLPNGSKSIVITNNTGGVLGNANCGGCVIFSMF